MNLRERFDRKWVRDPKTGCHLWIACKSSGYGRIRIRRVTHYAHRLVWEMTNGAIPDGLVIDHVCRNRACVNPAHLRVVPRSVNNTENSVSPAARNVEKTHCPRGHELTPDNTYHTGPSRRWRICRKCRIKKSHDNYHAKMAQAKGEVRR